MALRVCRFNPLSSFNILAELPQMKKQYLLASLKHLKAAILLSVSV